MNQKNFIKRLTFDLIRIKTLSKNKAALETGFKIICKLVSEHLGKEVEIKRFCRAKTVSFFLKNKRASFVKILLSGHLDVVPGKAGLFWPKIKDGLILGRGALDMKGPLATTIFSFIKALKKNNRLPLGLLITSDEEIGGQNGVGWLAPKFKNCQVVIVPDAQVDFNLVHLQKAPFHFTIKAKGKTGHASRPWLGENAAEKLISCLFKIQELNFSQENGDTLAITQISGGEASNKIPLRASAMIDARLIAFPGKSQLVKKVKTICQECKCSFKPIDKGLLFSIEKKNKFLKLWKRIAEEKLKKQLKFVKECGASDARFFARQNIPVIITSPIGGGQHGDQEWVNLESLCLLADITGDFLLKSSLLLE